MELGTAISTDEAEVLADYTSVSAMAIVALLFGLAAPLAFVAPLLIAVPILGIAISLLAIAHIDSSEGRLVGRSAALAGLSLAVISASAVPTYSHATRWFVSSEARDFAEAWLNLLRSGESATAFQLTMASERTGPPPETGAEPIGHDHEPTSPLAKFTESPPVSTLLELGDKSSLRFRQTFAYLRLPNNEFQVSQLFDVFDEADELAVAVEVILRRRRPHHAEGTPNWRVEVCQDAEIAEEI